jgi:Ca2+-binding RTX toxin-like protein
MSRAHLWAAPAVVVALCLQVTGPPRRAAAQEPAPSQLVYSTYFGGADAEEMGSEVEVDPAGNAYLAGGTLSRDYPFTDVAPGRPGRHEAVAPVTKLTAAGEIVYSTYVEGASFAQGLAVDAAGNAYVTGYAYEDLATTAGAFDESYNGEDDAFVAKLDPDGEVVWTTYLGGELPDGGTDVEVDGAGNVYVTGYTFSESFPTTPGAFETERPGSYDAFVAKISADGSQLVFATYLGGESSERGIELTGDPTLDLDPEGRVHVAGRTSSRDFPTTSLPFGYPRRGNAFVSTFSADGTDLLFSTVVGGRSADGATDVEVGAGGTIYLVGNTGSDDFPVSDGAFDTQLDRLYRSDEDGFVVALHAGGALDYATLLGGRGGEELSTIEPLDDGTVWVTGSGGLGYPTSPDAFDPFPPVSDQSTRWARVDPAGDVVVTRVDADGTGLVYSTFLGGTRYELARDVELAGEDVVVAGYSESHNLPTTVDAVRLSADEPASHNMFLTRLRPGVGEPCTNHGHDGDETVTGSGANDLLCGFGGADDLDGLAGNDVLYGDAGADALSGGGGADVLLAGGGDDRAAGNDGPDVLFGEAGDDTMRAGEGDDRSFIGGNEDQLVDGGPGDDVLRGGRFFDLLIGRAGRDVLYGRGGPDVLRGGREHDGLRGGRGRDKCLSGGGRDLKKSCEL